MKSKRGDVILLDHPFSDATGSKIRPALVIQADFRNSILTETIVALITKNTRFVAIDPTQLFIDISTPDGKANGSQSEFGGEMRKTLHDSRKSRSKEDRHAVGGNDATD